MDRATWRRDQQPATSNQQPATSNQDQRPAILARILGIPQRLFVGEFMRRLGLLCLALGCGLLLAPPRPLTAQQTLGSGAASTTAKADPGVKKVLGLADIAR